jgi:hypothetical protein
MTGAIDELRIYDVALTAAEVAALSRNELSTVSASATGTPSATGTHTVAPSGTSTPSSSGNPCAFVPEVFAVRDAELAAARGNWNSYAYRSVAEAWAGACCAMPSAN